MYYAFKNKDLGREIKEHIILVLLHGAKPGSIPSTPFSSSTLRLIPECRTLGTTGNGPTLLPIFFFFISSHFLATFSYPKCSKYVCDRIYAFYMKPNKCIFGLFQFVLFGATSNYAQELAS